MTKFLFKYFLAFTAKKNYVLPSFAETFANKLKKNALFLILKDKAAEIKSQFRYFFSFFFRIYRS
jgi:hypothetical protein